MTSDDCKAAIVNEVTVNSVNHSQVFRYSHGWEKDPEYWKRVGKCKDKVTKSCIRTFEMWMNGLPLDLTHVPWGTPLPPQKTIIATVITDPTDTNILSIDIVIGDEK